MLKKNKSFIVVICICMCMINVCVNAADLFSDGEEFISDGLRTESEISKEDISSEELFTDSQILDSSPTKIISFDEENELFPSEQIPMRSQFLSADESIFPLPEGEMVAGDFDEDNTIDSDIFVDEEADNSNTSEIVINLDPVGESLIENPGENEIVCSGTCGKTSDELTWTLDAIGTLRISGVGEMKDYASNTVPFSDETIGSVKVRSVVIDSGVTSIGNYAFNGCCSLMNIVIPDSVTRIGHSSFANCSSMTGIFIPESVQTIEDWAFHFCTSLSAITVDENNSVYRDIDGVLLSKDAKDLIVYPPGKKTNPYEVPNGVNRIRRCAFSDCYNVREVVVSDTVTYMERSAFSSCINLTTIRIPASVVEMEYDIFDGCCNLKIYGDAGTRAYDYACLNNIPFVASIVKSGNCGADGNNITWTLDGTGLLTISGTGKMKDYNLKSLPFVTEKLGGISVNQLIIEEGVTGIGAYAFANCYDLTKLTLPGTINSIGKYAFSGCWFQWDIELPESMTSIGAYAFSECGFPDIIIPESVTRFEDCAFYDCYGSNISIPDSVTYIGEKAFCGCGNVSEFIIPDSVTAIGDYVFRECNSLRTITLPNSIKSIGDGAFMECLSLKSVILQDGLTQIGELVFYGCTNLSSLILPNSLKSIGEQSFLFCKNLKEISIPQNMTTIWEGAFSGCESLEKVNIPNGVRKIGASAFSSCTNLKDVIFPDGLKSIEAGAFAGCLSLKKIVIPDSVTSVGESAFSGCIGLESIRFSSHMKKIMPSMCTGCTSLKSVVIPESILRIGMWAFSECTGLTSISIPDGVTGIEESCFDQCINLRRVNIPVSVKSFGEGVFEICDHVTIYGYAGSAAQKYAYYNNIRFVSLNGTPLLTTPTALKAKVSETGVSLSWKAVENAHSYIIYRIIGTKTVKIGTTGNLAFIDKKAVNGSMNSYYVKASAFGCKTSGASKKAKVACYLTAPKPALKSINTKTLTVNWKKNTKATGYQIRYSLNSNMSASKTVNIKNAVTVNTIIKNLKAKKIYYIQMRSYKKTGSKTYYSAWSGKKKLKVK